MADMHNQEAQTIKNYLVTYCRTHAGDTVNEKLGNLLDKLAKYLGVSNIHNLITGNFPAQKLASLATGGLKIIYFQGYFDANYVKNNPGTNPYDPVGDGDNYVQYLLYSWALGRPGYVYNNLKDYGPIGRHPKSHWQW